MVIDGVDGVTHINVFSKGNTELGRWLSNFSYSPIDVEGYGRFNSVEGLWYYLGSLDENLRNLHGYAAKEYGRKAVQVQRLDKEEFKRIILKAIDTKLKSDRSKLNMLRESTLPLCHYYEYGGKRIDAGYEWIVEHLEGRRSLLRGDSSTAER